MKTRVMLPQPSNYHEPGEQPGAAFPCTFSGSGSCQQLDLGLLASSTGDRTLLPFRNTQCVVLCYGMPRRRTWSTNILSKGKPPLCSL